MDNYLECTTTVSIDELNCKPIIDLIDNSDCNFWYVPSEQLGYVSFKTSSECFNFIEQVEDIKDDIVYLYDCYNND